MNTASRHRLHKCSGHVENVAAVSPTLTWLRSAHACLNSRRTCRMSHGEGWLDAAWCVCLGLLCLLRRCIVVFGLISLGLHCFLRLSSAGLVVVWIPGCCWAYSAFSVCHTGKAKEARNRQERQTNGWPALPLACGASQPSWPAGAARSRNV